MKRNETGDRLRRSVLSIRSTPHRRGLSTLELVLALPILLMVMALMVNYGTVACWKVRGLTMARQALWETRWPRTGSTNPRPEYWPAAANTGPTASGGLQELDDAAIDQPVARGPLPQATVNRNLLDPTRGLRTGAAELTRNFPLLAKVGPYHFQASTSMLDDKWQYQRMGMGSNQQRRIPILYALAKAPAEYAAAYVRAAMTLLNAPFRPQLRPLDNDDEFNAYGAQFGWGGAPDFHPRLQEFGSLDRSIAQDRVTDTIYRIRGETKRDGTGHVTQHIDSVAETMAQAFISLYERVMARPEAAGQAAALQAKIDILQKFLPKARAASGG